MSKRNAQKAADRKKRNKKRAHEGEIAKRARIIELEAKKRRTQDERVLHQIAAHTEALKIKHPELFERLAQATSNPEELHVHFGESAQEVLAAIRAVEAAGGSAMPLDLDPNVFVELTDEQIMEDLKLCADNMNELAADSLKTSEDALHRELAARHAIADPRLVD